MKINDAKLNHKIEQVEADLRFHKLTMSIHSTIIGITIPETGGGYDPETYYIISITDGCKVKGDCNNFFNFVALPSPVSCKNSL